ncbi:putative membrane protein [Clostridium bornimense]|uniref:Putative membrane protein n=1 Tax=Clostridium bornimense TaxID=1216932 RepID=W6SHN8_9CLOT|nr:oligosaccharide flippase family protein [Clostridium bornimense]CDM69225.1 putative membrane protein [Clostridium bornimense]
MASIKKNLLYNILYQVLIVIVPFITSPYLARTLGAEQIGVYSYTYSIVFYFMILAVLGVNNYGNRSIAKVRDNKEKLNIEFWSIYFIQITMSTLVIIAYIIYLVVIVSEYRVIAIIQGLYILSNAIDITWFFQGIEEFKIVVLRNSVVKIISLVLILLLVKSPMDLWIYTIIMAGSTFLGQVITWPLLLKKVIFKKPVLSNIVPHIKPIFILFLPVLAISIFSYMDKIMLGVMKGMKETGFYENTDKIISIPKSIITALGAVMLPRTANLIANGKYEKSKEYIENTMFYVMLISSACAFGLAGISNNFAIIFWGKEFSECGRLIAYMVPTLIFSVFGNVIRTQYLIPRSMDKEYIISLIMGAIVNFIVNMSLIPSLGALGAVIGTICSEFVLCSYQIYSVHKDLDIKGYVKSGIAFFPIGFMMFLILKYIECILKNSISALVIQILIGASVYLLLASIYIIKSKNLVVMRMREALKLKFKGGK